ncbi:MAG: GNAT family N-acetyltransferase [Alphaproteobacteria bacterium]|nr:GNAT family N-acetyltransferase [Alphaproteobacteria bacterium]
MAAPPKTVLYAPPEEEAAIRAAVRACDPSIIGPNRRLATQRHVEGLVQLLSDPLVSDPLYGVPRPFTERNILHWVEDFTERKARGEGVLIVTTDFADQGVVAYSQITIWPDRTSGETAGAISADIQSLGSGGSGAMRTFGWMYGVLGIRLIGLTAAIDNVRSAKLIERAGFIRMGERDSVRPDGTIRRSLYWEQTRDQWLSHEPPFEPYREG